MVDSFNPTITMSNKFINRITYPNKFLDLGSTYFPMDIKELIRLGRIFYYGSPLLRSIVDKMSEYPISDLIMEVGEEANNKQSVKEKYDEILDEHINIRNILQEAGLSYMVNGNVIMSMNLDFRRQFECSACKGISDGELFEEFKVKVIQKEIKILGTCPRCGAAHVELSIHDVPIKSAEALNVIMWNPLQLDVEYNQWNGKKKFLYTVPKDIKNRLLTATSKRDKVFLLTLPKIYFDAVEKDKAIELDVFHFGTPELPQDKTGFNVPVVVSVLKDIWYYNTMRKAQESILGEHIVPFRSIFPQPTGALDPFTMMRMDKWTAFVKDQVNLHKKDPNHIMITPVPVGTVNIGGDAKYLMMTNEMRLVQEDITQGFGAPLELIRGGVSWSGSSISLRILENHFLSFRRDLELMMNTFVLPKIAKLLGIPKAKVRFSRLRMGDDQQFKQLMFQLVQNGFFSLETLLEEFGFEPIKEKERVIQEAEWFNKLKKIQGRGQAEIQGIQQLTLAKYNVRAQEVQMYETAMVQYTQQQAGQGLGVNPQIKELAQQYMNLRDDASRKAFLKQVFQQHGEDTVRQLVEFLQQLSEQEMNPDESKDSLEQVDKAPSKVGAPPTGRTDRKTERTDDRVKGSKKTAS